jgi:ornithine cyclodeaminase
MSTTLRINKDLNIVPFVSVDHMMKIVGKIGLENMLTGIAEYIESDFKCWELFDKTPRVASHSDNGVICQ